jgi:hypothetical protein
MGDTVERMERLSIREVAQAGGESNPEITAALASVGISIVTTRQRLGGVRRWLQCPECRRRYSSLYATDAGIVCRRCAGLSYESQRLNAAARLRRRAFALYDRLNVDYSQWPRVAGPKPAKLRWREYWKLYELANELDCRSVVMGASRRLLKRIAE